jgi:anti-sigma factor RsiW
MQCGEMDLKAYLLGEATAAGRRGVEAHLETCAACRAEFERLDVTRAAMLALPAEEPPRRIAFVSDKVFEPRWWRRLSLAGLLAPAALAAVTAFAVVKLQPPPAVPMAAVQSAPSEEKIAREVAARLDEAVKRAVAESESRQQARALEMVRAAEQRLMNEHREAVAMMEADFEMMRKRMNTYYRASADYTASGMRAQQ